MSDQTSSEECQQPGLLSGLGLSSLGLLGTNAEATFAQRLLNSLFAFVGVLDLQGTLVGCNQAPLTAAGISLSDVVGKKFWDCYWWSHDAAVQARLRAACEAAVRGTPARYDVTIRTAGDGRAVIDFQLMPLCDEHGHITHLVPSAIDITARNRAQEELQRSKELVNTIAENSTLGLAMMDDRGYCIYANRTWQQMTGYSADELRARPLHELVHHHYPDGRPYPIEACPIDRALPENFDLRAHEDLFFRKDGTAFSVSCAASPIFKDGRSVSTVIEIRDLTEAKRLEQELRESEARARAAAAEAEAERSLLDAIFAAAPVGIIVADASGKIVRMNPGNERLWGPAPYSSSVANFAEWKGWWADGTARHGQRLEPHEWALARALNGETVRGDIVEFEPFEAPTLRRTMMNSGAPVRDLAGRIVGGVVAQVDISGLVRAEAALSDLRQAQAALRASLEEKETLLREIHHRVKNNLQVICSLLSLNSARVVDPTALAAFRDSQNRVRSIALLHEKLYEAQELALVDCGEYVRSLLAHLLESHGAIAEYVDAAVRVDGVFLPIDLAVPCGLILNELLTNALKHGRPSATRHLQLCVTLQRQDDEVLMTVADNGPGPTAELNGVSRGTLGINLVRTLARQLGGDVSFATEVGVSCTVRFRQPRPVDV